MRKKYIVRLSEEEKAELEKLISKGSGPARKLNHARILLKADADWPDEKIKEALDTSQSTIERVREAFVLYGLGAALNRKRPSKTLPPKLDGAQEAYLLALTCSSPPEGYDCWTLRLLANRMVELEHVESLSYETVRRTLKKATSNPG